MAEEINGVMLMESTKSQWVIQDEEDESSNIENFDADLRLGWCASMRLICTDPHIDSFNVKALEVPDAHRKLGVLLTPPSGGENAENWKGLESKRKLQIKFEDLERPACDIAISGLRWFTIEPMFLSFSLQAKQKCNNRKGKDKGKEERTTMSVPDKNQDNVVDGKNGLSSMLSE
ncbi:putative nitric oxide synthase, partial [Mucuna pruriens]